MAQGERIREVLKQPQYEPLPVEKQVVIIYAAVKKYLLDLETAQGWDFQDALFELVDTKYPEIWESIRETKVITEETEKKIVQAIDECKNSLKR